MSCADVFDVQTQNFRRTQVSDVSGGCTSWTCDTVTSQFFTAFWQVSDSCFNMLKRDQHIPKSQLCLGSLFQIMEKHGKTNSHPVTSPPSTGWQAVHVDPVPWACHGPRLQWGKIGSRLGHRVGPRWKDKDGHIDSNLKDITDIYWY